MEANYIKHPVGVFFFVGGGGGMFHADAIWLSEGHIRMKQPGVAKKKKIPPTKSVVSKTTAGCVTIGSN